MQQMIIANRLADGAVVFLARGDEWVTSIGDGALIDEPDAERSMAIAKRHESESLIVDPSLIEVTMEDGRPRPVAIREAIRAFGPTVRTDVPRDQAQGASRVPAVDPAQD